VHVADTRADLPDLVAEIYKATENVVLIEKYLPGREFCIAVAGPVTSCRGHLVRRAEPFTFAALERVLTDDEKIFTSMDVRPITADRFRAVSRRTDPELLNSLHRIARDTYLEFDLGSLIRLDLRSDAAGELYILEANPKPDLKVPSEGVTSLISAGLAESGMDYDDLVLSLIADRLDFLFAHRRGSIGHVLDLLDAGRPKAVGVPTPEQILDRSVLALQATLDAARSGKGQNGFAGAARALNALQHKIENLTAGSDQNNALPNKDRQRH
jgi:D-alanine-D-alanine ligase